MSDLVTEEIVREALKVGAAARGGICAALPCLEPECDCWRSIRAALSAVADKLVRGEREACARASETFTIEVSNKSLNLVTRGYGEAIAAAIRARSTKETEG